jgi:NIPSNAP
VASRSERSSHPSRVVELRRYALRTGERETLIELFDRELVEAQEAVGMHVLGQFRDLDNPDSFVWMRGFGDMKTRKRALEAFYGGPVWREHAPAARATMIDARNVLLLRPIAGLELDRRRRAAAGTSTDPPGLLAVTIWPLGLSTAGEVPALFHEAFDPALRAAGLGVLAVYATDHSENTFPALPVRDKEEVLVWMSMFHDEADHSWNVNALQHSSQWRDALKRLSPYLVGDEEVLRLSPTPRSALHA